MNTLWQCVLWWTQYSSLCCWWTQYSGVCFWWTQYSNMCCWWTKYSTNSPPLFLLDPFCFQKSPRILTSFSRKYWFSVGEVSKVKIVYRWIDFTAVMFSFNHFRLTKKKWITNCHCLVVHSVLPDRLPVWRMVLFIVFTQPFKFGSNCRILSSYVGCDI